MRTYAGKSHRKERGEEKREKEKKISYIPRYNDDGSPVDPSDGMVRVGDLPKLLRLFFRS